MEIWITSALFILTKLFGVVGIAGLLLAMIAYFTLQIRNGLGVVTSSGRYLIPNTKKQGTSSEQAIQDILTDLRESGLGKFIRRSATIGGITLQLSLIFAVIEYGMSKYFGLASHIFPLF